jgi:3-oxoacyl-[acyl-carrier-protein] synthase-3
VQRTGIRERRFIEESGIGASDLALPAVKMACEQAGREVKDVDAVLFATLSPDHNFPGAGCLLIHKLGLPGVPALDVRNQCSGFLYSLSVADAWIRGGVYKNVLVVGSEVHSTGLEFNERGRDVAVLFGDGAGAVLVGEATRPSQGVHSLELHADGAGAYDLWLEAPASKIDPPRLTHEMLDARQALPADERQAGVPLGDREDAGGRALGGRQGRPDDGRHRPVRAAPGQHAHQPGRRAKLGIADDRVVHNIERYGNTTAATIPIGISESWREGKIKDGSRVLMVAFGAGFTWAGGVAVF